jgi:AcrR family transcriptional regulator
MPKIDAGSVREHRERRRASLIDAAEAILAEQGVDALTTGAIAARAGIARNSVYRYFDSIEELVELVVTRGFPLWVDAVRAAVDAEGDPERRVLAYVTSNLSQAQSSAHGWRASLARTTLSDSARRRVHAMHVDLNEILTRVVAELGAAQPVLLSAVLQSLTDAGIRRIDRGDDADEVIDFMSAAAQRLLS